MLERYLLILLAVLLAGSIGAFFLYVAILPMIGIVAVLLAMAAIFGLGFYVGRNPEAMDDLLAHINAVPANQDEPVAMAERSVDSIRLADELTMHH